MIIFWILSIANISQYGLGEFIGSNEPFSPMLNPADINFKNVHFGITGMFEYTESGNYGFIIKDGLFSIPFKGFLGLGVSYNEVYDNNYNWVISTDTLMRDTLEQSISGIGEIGKYSIFLGGKWKKIKMGLAYSWIFGTPMEVWKIDFAHSQDAFDTLFYSASGNIFNIGFSYGNYNKIGVRYTYPDSFTVENCDSSKQHKKAYPEKIFLEGRFHINENLYIDILYGTSNIKKLQISGYGFDIRGEILGDNFNNGASKYIGGGYTFQFSQKRKIRIGMDFGEIKGKFPDRLLRGEIRYIYNENW